MTTYAERCMLGILAHPDDECFHAGSWIRYRREGVKTILATCTLGEEGELHDPSLDPAEVLPRITEYRERELRCSAQQLELSELVLLKYRDSGMAGSPANQRPDVFINVNFAEALERVVRLVRLYRPQILITHDERGGYGHPDHIMAHRLTVAAFDAAGDATRFPDAGAPWQPLKLYYTAVPRSYFMRLRTFFIERGEPDPFERFEREAKAKAEAEGKSLDDIPRIGFGVADEQLTTHIMVPGTYDQKLAAMRCHRTQMNPKAFWFVVPKEEAISFFEAEHFVLGSSHVTTSIPEDDLFAGIESVEA